MGCRERERLNKKGGAAQSEGDVGGLVYRVGQHEGFKKIIIIFF